MARRSYSWRGTPGDRLLQAILTRPALPAPRRKADVYETVDGDAFVIEIAVPGVQLDDITIEATTDTLTVSTRPRQAESEAGRRYIHREQLEEPRSWVVEFPVDIDTDNTQATLELGILKIHAPKAAAGRRKVIKVDRAA